MKLLMISGDRTLASGRQGAFFETLSELCKHFERIDILCPALTRKGGGEKQQVRVIHDKVYIHLSPFPLLLQPYFILRKGQELLKVHHHDVMTVHDYPPFYNGIGARLLKRRINIPTVLEIHHIVGWPKASSVSEFIGHTLSRLFLGLHTRKFDAVRVVNETVRSLLIEWGAASKSINVVSSVYLDRTMIATVKNSTKKFDLVFAARLSHNKGLMPVIRSMALLPTATLLVIGDGSVRHRAELVVRSLGLSSRVTFAGWLQGLRDVLSGIASGKLFLMNSKSEGNPRVAIEAMALGVPVLATRVGIMPDVIIDGVNGVFTNGSAKDIAAKAQMLLADDAKRASMGLEAAKISGRFEKTAAIQAYADFLKSLAS